ncbi:MULTISPECIES: 2-oxo acid dehydrogenase subunit E2 [unclassified Nocardioides]|uniref:2-oxo acid dehydrogenase subunit E2 n=1 Tax=unclassified Nocardioides TaxID=2615069 RepID=UPI0007009FAD|nr:MULTISPECIES: 2-oxo acid dehydrogenase subunit E2 [unclassified Nocardioides]KQY56780.1 branched-chain alpha-keto acid dehydrogenase subunit E2 [Nocardioides sp. Root140]KQZ67024.1 branched-chain alpha-keto acid dehydrogenase subunit E2 [Nocardioides sp. Root151]KRF12900.1 branched-chain alpha-keto acid dehydrogenase subunit E2 [Nocardioides sp. Soil796]
MEIKVPDIGDFTDVPVIELLVSPGDVVQAEDPLVTLETDKATMEIPSPVAGTIVSLSVKVDDLVSRGSVIAIAETAEAGPETVETPETPEAPEAVETPEPVEVPETPTPAAVPAPVEPAPAADSETSGTLRATPLVRRLARELTVDLATVTGSGPGRRVTKQDLLTHYERSLAPSAAGSSGIPAVPEVDFSKFGPIRTVPLSRIKKLSGPHLHRSWLNVPHVTHSDEADITDLDAYRRELDDTARAEGYRVTLLSFLLKAVAASLRKFPEVNSSLAGDELVLKDYVHIGVAVDTPDGLVVPVVRDVDRKGALELSRELGDLSARAREGKLTAADMQGATFTISSLGGIGGTAFTPIVNAPEVAILGVVRSKMAPVWDGEAFVPRLMLPLCLSYDHRVIDGALAARFTAHLTQLTADVRRLAL